ncbi:MAG TPA: hypothetical protein VGF53_10335 [Pseudolabrys sp.]|jgi:hypothetical protein
MKNFIALAMLVALSATAQAKFAPVEPQPATISLDDLAISTEPAATRERDYFSAPPSTFTAGRTAPCRVQLIIFDKTRLAQLCH